MLSRVAKRVNIKEKIIMRSKKILCSNGWYLLVRTLLDKKDGLILKITLRQKNNPHQPQIHIWGNNAVEELIKFLNDEPNREHDKYCEGTMCWCEQRKRKRLGVE
jgi:hypothetical protein